MQTYIIFFGKSQSFRFEAYDSSGHISDFSTIITDLEDLESRVVVVNKIDNKNIYAHYKIKIGTKTFTLLKVFKCAQAFDGNRVEGSICGVAFLSTGNLNINEENINLLNILLKSFEDLALTGNKFKQIDFKPITDSIWKAFIDQVSFNKISTSPYIGNFVPNTIAIGLKNIEDIFIAQSKSNFLDNQRVYFTEDLELLKYCYQRWEDRLQLYFLDNHNLKLYSKEALKQPEDKRVTSSNDESRIKTYELEVSFKQEKKLLIDKMSKLNGKNKLLIFLLSFTLIANTGYFFYNEIFAENIPQSVSIETPIIDTPQKIDNTESIVTLEIFEDTARLKKLNSLFSGYLNLLKISDSIKFEKSRKEFNLNVKKTISIDSIELNKIILNYKNLKNVK